MKPMHKGVGLIVLATGATVLAINLLGGAKEEAADSSAVAAQSSQLLKTEASARVQLASEDVNAATSVNKNEVAVGSEMGSSGMALKSPDEVNNAATTDVKLSAEQSAAELIPTPIELEAIPEDSVSARAETVSNQAPPPGLFRESDLDTVEASSMEAPEAPASPVKPAEMSPGLAPVQPEAVSVEMLAPEAPEGIVAELDTQQPEAPVAPVAVEAAGSAPKKAVLSITTPPEITDLKKTAEKVEAIGTEPDKGAEGASDQETGPEQAVLSITTPPEMPDLEKIGINAEASGTEPNAGTVTNKEIAVTPVAKNPVTPEAPKPDFIKPKAPLTEDQGVSVPKYQDKLGAMQRARPYMQRPIPMPQGMMPGPKMGSGQGVWGDKGRPSRGMPAPSAGYIPRVYYVPVPLMPYGQTMMPYPGGNYGYPMYPAPMPSAPAAPKKAVPAPQGK